MAYSRLCSARRVVLVGQERVGKSSAGNTILGKALFASKVSLSPLTLRSEMREADVQGQRVSVVDTPGLFSTRLTAEEVKEELEEALQLSSPGPHAFILVIQVGRFTPQEQEGLKTLQKMLKSPDLSKHTMVLFTYGDRLENTNIDTEKFIKEDEEIQKLLKSCSGVYHVFNNNKMENRDQVRELLAKIDQISNEGQRYYERRSQSGWSVWRLIPRDYRRVKQIMWFVCILLALRFFIKSATGYSEHEHLK